MVPSTWKWDLSGLSTRDQRQAVSSRLVSRISPIIGRTPWTQAVGIAHCCQNAALPLTRARDVNAQIRYVPRAEWRENEWARGAGADCGHPCYHWRSVLVLISCGLWQWVSSQRRQMGHAKDDGPGRKGKPSSQEEEKGVSQERSNRRRIERWQRASNCNCAWFPNQAKSRMLPSHAKSFKCSIRYLTYSTYGDWRVEQTRAGRVEENPCWASRQEEIGKGVCYQRPGLLLLRCLSFLAAIMKSATCIYI